MRWSAGVFVALVGLILVVGPACRNIPTENTDRNRAPETYLTAAPLDSIAGGTLVRIPHRFRVQWSGSDVDGEVIGFYVAVTETTVENVTSRPFRLPPPKPSQYHFTTSHESLFTFSVLEGRGNDRQHALYVYCVDNQGRVDPTPAFTHFVARDQFLPEIEFTLAQGQGTIFVPAPGGGVTPIPFNRNLTDSFEVPAHAPVDTIPSGGSVSFAWRGTDRDFGSIITGYQYKLTETDFVHVDSLVTSAEYGTGFGPNPAPIPVGQRIFRIRAQDEAGGTTQPDALRQFVVNFGPDTWFAGPDPVELAPYLQSDSLGSYLPLDGQNRPVPFPNHPLLDSLKTLPADRPPTDGVFGRPNKTFIEVRTLLDKTVRYYLRSEGDTVAFGSSFFVRFGGSDADSPFQPRGGSPNAPPESLLFHSGPANGSPIAFQVKLFARSAGGGGEDFPFSTPFPNANILDPFYNPKILYSLGDVRSTGVIYLVGKAVDGDRASDGRVPSNVENVIRTSRTACGCPPTAPADCVPDLESHPTEACRIRSKILVMPTNFNPGLLVTSPQRDEVLNPVGNRISVFMRATDPDPDPTNPSLSQTYRTMYFTIRARLYAPDITPGPEEGWQDPFRPSEVPDPTFFPYTRPLQLNLDVPPTLPDGPAILEIEVQDNVDRNRARIISVQIPIYWRVGP